MPGGKMKTWILSWMLVAACGASVPAAAVDAGEGMVRGTASFRERIALPPGTVFEATLEDVSLADAPAVTLATFSLQDAGNPPYRFELAYDPASIVPSRRYAVRARVTLAGRLLFTTDQSYPVITQGSPTTVEVLMKRVGGAAGRAATGKPGEIFATLPATFTGVLPCADCAGIEHHLDLMPDGSYVLRMRYLGTDREGTFDDIGTWALSSDGITLALKGGREAPEFFSIEDAGTLRKLDIMGRPIESALDYDLRRAEAFEPIEPRLAMGGMFRYMADAADFRECTTGRSLPVAMEGAYIELERAYTALPKEGPPPVPVMALVEGRIAMRPPMEGPGPVPTLVVDRFLRLVPGEACPPRYRTVPLADTTWALVALGEEAVFPPEGRPAAQLLLQSADGRAAGSNGCNRFMAGYTVEDDRIQFSPAATTRMACPGTDELARRFDDALASAVRWRVLGEQLEFYDDGGRLLARFQAGSTP
jgi:copper homeostasis protein (lipoprotein)